MSQQNHTYCIVHLQMVRNQNSVYKDLIKSISKLLVNREVLILVVVISVCIYILRPRRRLIQEVLKQRYRNVTRARHDPRNCIRQSRRPFVVRVILIRDVAKVDLRRGGFITPALLVKHI